MFVDTLHIPDWRNVSLPQQEVSGQNQVQGTELDKFSFQLSLSFCFEKNGANYNLSEETKNTLSWGYFLLLDTMVNKHV